MRLAGRVLLGFAALALAIGGGLALRPAFREEWGPERFPTARVLGVVHERDRPIGGGWIEFLPVEGTRGTLRSAPVRPDGTFSADRVPVGRVAVRLVDPPPEVPVAPVFLGFTSPIRRTIRAGQLNSLDVDLWAERLHLLRGRPSG